MKKKKWKGSERVLVGSRRREGPNKMGLEQ